MLGIRHIKPSPTTYLLAHRGGRLRRAGASVPMLYFAPGTTLVSIPLADQETPFMLAEVSGDFQEVTLQGEASFRVVAPEVLAARMDFSLAADGSTYASEDPERLVQRVLTQIQVVLRGPMQARPPQALLTQSTAIEAEALESLKASEAQSSLGLSLTTLSILGIRPTPTTARALEAEIREQILKRADDATYARRNAAIEQERQIRENELTTDLAVQARQREIREADIEGERVAQEHRQEIEAQVMVARIAREQQNATLVELQIANARKESEARAVGLRAQVQALAGADARVLQALAMSSAGTAAMIASAFQGLAENAGRIGALNITPDLLQGLTGEGDSLRRP